jgi:hypothetical protein
MCAGTVFPQKTCNVKHYILQMFLYHTECYIPDQIFFNGEFADCVLFLVVRISVIKRVHLNM